MMPPGFGDIPDWFVWAIVGLYVGATMLPSVFTAIVSSLLLSRVSVKFGVLTGLGMGLASTLCVTAIATLIGLYSNTNQVRRIEDAFIVGAVVVIISAVLSGGICYLRNQPRSGGPGR